MPGGRRPLVGLARAAAPRLLATATMLAATAAVMVAAGGTGVLGPLGALIGGAASAGQEPDATGSAREPRDAIVAVVPSAPARVGTTVARAPATAPGDRPAAGADGAPPVARVPRPSRRPAAPAPAPEPRPPEGAPPASPPPPTAPPRAIDRVDAAVDGVAAQAPGPAQPLLRPAQDVLDAVADTCRQQLPACP